MKLGFVPTGNGSDTPLIRLFDFTTDEAVRLHGLFLTLASGDVSTAALHDRAWIQSVDGCQLWLRFGNRDKGVIVLEAPSKFECIYSSEGWLELAGKTKPFIAEIKPCTSQWLTNEGMNLLLSPDGRW